MKVLQINSVCGFGSTGRIAADLSDELTRSGHDCTIAYGRGTAPAGLHTIKIGSETNVRLHGVYSRFTDRHGFFSKSATEKFVKAAKEYNPDIIHLHNLHGYYLHLPTLFSYLKEADKPVVWTLHDCWSFTGHCAYFSFAGCEKWKYGCNHCPQIHSYPLSIYADKSEQNYSDKKVLFTSLKNLNLVTPSNWLADTVKQSFLGHYPVKVIQNGIDLSIFKPTEGNFRKKHGIEDKKVLLGVANVWEPRKGFNDFLRLSHLLDESYVIVLVGIKREQMTLLPKNIIGIERTENIRELAEIYTTSDVYLNPSTEETMGLTTVEALACGTPVVVYDATAVPEVVDNTCGKIVPAGDVNALYRAILGIECRSVDCIKKAQTYEKSKKYQEYIELYQSLK